MGEFSRLASSKAEDRQPDLVPQAYCDCGREAKVALFDVVNTYTGQVERGVASEFSTVKGGQITGFLRDGLRLNQSIGLCADCYCGRKPSSGPPASAEIAAAWSFVISQWDHDSLVLGDTPIETVDRYLEICNGQVSLSGNWDALPTHCQLDKHRRAA